MAKQTFVTGIAFGVIATLLVGIAAWLTVVYTGAYNVAATDEHADIARWTLDTTMRNSVRDRAQDLQMPEHFTPEMVAAGAPIYASTCAHCHAAPGAERAPWASGMRPMPPELVEAAAHWEPREIFWIAKHGIKMTGMPAFGPRHDDEALLAVTALVSQLPGMSAEDYHALAGESAGEHRHGGSGH